MHTFLQFGTEPNHWPEHITLRISLWNLRFLIYDCPLRVMLYCRWAKFMRMTAAHIQRHLIHLSAYTPTLSYIQQPAPTQQFNHTSPKHWRAPAEKLNLIIISSQKLILLCYIITEIWFITMFLFICSVGQEWNVICER